MEEATEKFRFSSEKNNFNFGGFGLVWGAKIHIITPTLTPQKKGYTATCKLWCLRSVHQIFQDSVDIVFWKRNQCDAQKCSTSNNRFLCLICVCHMCFVCLFEHVINTHTHSRCCDTRLAPRWAPSSSLRLKTITFALVLPRRKLVERAEFYYSK